MSVLVGLGLDVTCRGSAFRVLVCSDEINCHEFMRYEIRPRCTGIDMRYDTSLIIIHLLIYIYTTLHSLLCQLSRTEDQKTNGGEREEEEGEET